MLKKVFVAAFAVIAIGAPAFAADNWIDQFLRRYKPSMSSLQNNRNAAVDSLQGLVQNGMIPLSIPDLINLTLQNNLDVSVNRQAPLTAGFAANTYYRPFEPTLRIGTSFGRETSPSTTQFTGTPSVTQNTHDITVGFGQTLPSGTQLAANFSLDRTSSNNAFTTFNPAWIGVMQYSISQPLLKGHGRDINTKDIRIAQNNKSMSEAQFEMEVVDIVTQAQKTYWDLVFTAEDLKVKQRTLDLAQKTLSDNQKQVDAGSLAPVDLIPAEEQVATSNESMIVSQYAQVQIGDQIKKIASRQQDPGLVLAMVSPTDRAPLPGAADVLPVDQAIKVALENRPERRQAALDLKNKDITVTYAKNQLLPSLSLSAAFTQNGVGGVQTIRDGFGSSAPILQVNPGGAFDALGQVFGLKYRGYSLGFNLEIPLRNRAPQADYARAVSDRTGSESRIKAVEQQIALEVRNSILQIQMTNARIVAAQKSRELAEQQLNAEQRKFELGASIVRFVVEEQRNLQQMQTNEIAALVNYAKALVDYDRALGLTLKKRNIEIERTLSAGK